jgi:acyl-CoA synthetase (AMP-forming)/AMP-acid ligase II
VLTPATLGDLLAAAARSDGDALAFRYGDERLSYADWDALATRVAGGLAAAGVRRGDVVALLLPPTPLYMMC